MALTLNITSYQSQTLGAESCRVFNEMGGSIGRTHGNDWVLPDPERFLSKRHATIHFQDGIYVLTDTSTNGVFINDSLAEVGNGKSVPLSNGDRLKFGDYECLVTIDAEKAMHPFSAQQEPMAAAPNCPDFLAADSTSDTEPGESLDPLDFLSASNGGRGHQAAPDSFAEPVDQPGAEPDHVPAMNESFQAPGARIEEIPDDWNKTFLGVTGDAAERRVPEDEDIGLPSIPTPRPSAPVKETKQPKAAGREFPGAGYPSRKQGGAVEPQAPPSGSDSDAFSDFLRGVGLDAAAIQQADSVDAMENYGRLFRVVVQGMMEVLMARASLKSEFRMPLTTIRPVENNPLKFSPNIDEAVRTLFLGHGSGYLAPEEAIMEGFEDIRDHQLAMVAGMQAAFVKMIRRFSPDTFKSKNAQDTGRVRAALTSINRKSRLWDAYSDYYRDLAQDPSAAFQKLFGDDFARAYEDQIQRLLERRRN